MSRPHLGRVCAFVAAGLAILAGVLRWWSPGKPSPLLDDRGRSSPGSISEKIHVRINGVEQGMFVKGRDVRNPVLLYLHGGMPDYFLTRTYPTGLEEDFVIVWWEQRGSGLSFHPDVPPETMTPEQLVADTIELARHLRERFGCERVYLMGHSGGTFIGIHAAAQAPELFHAYIGVAQMTSQLESERLAYEEMLERFRASGDTRMVRRLERAPVTSTVPLPNGYLSVRDVAMHRLGVGTTHDMRSIVRGLFLPSLRHPEYTVREKVNMWRGKRFSGRMLWDRELATDLREEIPGLTIPAHFLHGVHDRTVSYELARSYVERLEAPVKGFYTFEGSAHSPLFEEPRKTREILRRDVLSGTAGLADQDPA